MKGRPRMSGRSITSILEAIVEWHLAMQEIYPDQTQVLVLFHPHVRQLTTKV